MNVLSLSIALAGLLVGGSTPDRPSRLEPTSSEPVVIPADFCFGYIHTDKTCAATVSFPVSPDGTVGDIKFVKSSRDRGCDRAVMHSVKSRQYPASEGFFVKDEVVESQTCRSLFER